MGRNVPFEISRGQLMATELWPDVITIARREQDGLELVGRMIGDTAAAIDGRENIYDVTSRLAADPRIVPPMSNSELRELKNGLEPIGLGVGRIINLAGTIALPKGGK